ncbi:MAG TPA: hypothetical protein VKA63_08935 [Candidatus Krumholzibacteria bacterium]|nr:hypothetical protein [Candidatus Krumholzibacteria bacterium]
MRTERAFPRALLCRPFWAAVVLLGLWSLSLGAATGRAADDRDLLSFELERTDTVLEHVQENLREANNPRLHELFKQAVSVQELAKRLFESSSPTIDAASKLRVLGLTRRARDMALRIQREVRKDVTYQEQARRLLERSRALLERIDENSDRIRDPRVQAVLDKARRQLSTAEQQYADGNFEAALRLADSANVQLRNLIEAVRDKLSVARVERELDRTDGFLLRAKERSDEGDTQTQELLKQASLLQTRAREAASAQHLMQAMKLTRQSRKLLREILGEFSDSVSQEDFQQALQRFDARLERLREENEGKFVGPADQLVNQALQSRARAMQAADSQDYSTALARIRVGLDLLNRAGRLLGANSG